ncbi:MAG: YghX family hydrolase [Sedimentitalea sp.]|uniref:YghX family hydrolase n=1 Tax=Sedimentitalea sp. TaxID=2048915 RepID=UPI0032674D54
MPNPVRRKASDFDSRILEIFDGYVHGQMSKRDFITRAGRYAAAGVTGAMILEQLAPNYALAQQVAPDDPSIVTERITYESPDGHGTISGLMARPADAEGKLPAVLVVHENRGLNPYIEDVVRRAAKAGYLALGPDGLSPLGGYPGTDDEGREMQRSMDGAKLMEDFFAAFEFLRDHPSSTGKVGCVGFCYGGSVCNALAVAYPDLAASVPFYGRQPAAEDVADISAPLLIHYAGLDERINAGADAYAEALTANGKEFTVHVYPDVNHGFHNDTTPRYDAEAAALAWERTLAFFDTHLN